MSTGNRNVKISQQCVNPACNTIYPAGEILFGCKKCNGKLEYIIEGKHDGSPSFPDRDDQWKNFDLIPLENPKNIIALGAGGSKNLLLEELSGMLNNANLYLKLDSDKNPTGTFKDREASIVLSRCKEAGLDNLVFYSTGNTGRAYTHFAAHIGLTTYFFMPRQCQYKNTDFIKKNDNNHIILVDQHYPLIAPYAKKFATENGFTLIAPLHDRNESYATVAYEQFQELRGCNYYAQTIASGMGQIGFYKGHMNLVKLGLEKKEAIPRMICIQSSEMNVMAGAYNSGRTELTKDDLPKEFPGDLFEPTLNSTNPVNNYPDLYRCLKENNGIITAAEPEAALGEGMKLAAVLKSRGIILRTDLERSLLIGFAGLVKLAKQGLFKKGDNILLLAVGRGKDRSTGLIPPGIIIDPQKDHPVELAQRLKK